jgi:hypothetical protein
MSLEYCGIACIDESICEVDYGNVSTRVPIPEVRRVTVGFGYQSPHPILLTAMGGILLVPGAWAVFHFIHWAIFRGAIVWYEAGLIAFALAAIWLLAAARRRGFYLDVESVKGKRRLAFSEPPVREGLISFLETLDQHVAVPIQSLVPGFEYSKAGSGLTTESRL